MPLHDRLDRSQKVSDRLDLKDTDGPGQGAPGESECTES
jgi:hypothetical protein